MENLKLENERVELQERKVNFSGISRILKTPNMISPIILAMISPVIEEIIKRKLLKETGCNDINWLMKNYGDIKWYKMVNVLREIRFSKGILLQSDNTTNGWYYDMTWMNIVNDMYDELFGTFEWAH